MQTFNTELAKQWSKNTSNLNRWKDIITKIYNETLISLSKPPSIYSIEDLQILSYAYSQTASPAYDKHTFEFLDRETVIQTTKTALELYREILRRKPHDIKALHGAAYIYYRIATKEFFRAGRPQEELDAFRKFTSKRYAFALKAEKIYQQILKIFPNNITANYRYGRIIQVNRVLCLKNTKCGYVSWFRKVSALYNNAIQSYESMPETNDTTLTETYIKTLLHLAELEQDGALDNYKDKNIQERYMLYPDNPVPGYERKGSSINIDVATICFRKLLSAMNINLQNYHQDPVFLGQKQAPIRISSMLNRFSKLYFIQYRYQCFTLGRKSADVNLLESALCYALLSAQYEVSIDGVSSIHNAVSIETYEDIKRIAGIDEQNAIILKAKKKLQLI